jgi:hypothetical protein
VSTRCVNEFASYAEGNGSGKKELSRLRAQFLRTDGNIRSCLCFLLHNICSKTIWCLINSGNLASKIGRKIG